MKKHISRIAACLMFLCFVLVEIKAQAGGDYILINDNDRIDVEAGVYEYDCFLPEYHNEYPDISLHFQNETSGLRFSSYWPGYASFYVCNGTDSLFYKINFRLEEYEDVLFEDNFDSLTSIPELDFSSTLNFSNTNVLIRDAGKVLEDYKSILLTKDSKLRIKLPNVARVLPYSGLIISFDAVSSSSSKMSVTYANVEKASFTTLGDKNDMHLQNVEVAIPIKSQVSDCGLNVTSGSYIVDNIKIVSLLPALERCNYYDERFNCKIIQVDTMRSFIVEDSYLNDLDLKALEFYKRNDKSGSFYLDEDFNCNTSVEGGVDVVVYADTMKWHFISFPFDVDRITINDTVALSETDIRIKRYNSVTGEFDFIAYEDGPFGVLEKNEGYIMAVNASKYENKTPVKFKASAGSKSYVFCNDDVTIDLDRNMGLLAKVRSDFGMIETNRRFPSDGMPVKVSRVKGDVGEETQDTCFVLVGNPYPSYYTMDVDDVFLRYDGLGYDYDATSPIAPFESFFVLKNSSSYTFHSSNRLRGDEAGLQVGSKELSYKRIKLKVENSCRHDFADLRFADGKRNAGVLKKKLIGERIPYIYSNGPEGALLINWIETCWRNEKVNCSVIGGIDGMHRISVDNLSSMDCFEKIILEDDNGFVDLMKSDYEVELDKYEKHSFYIIPVFKNTVGNDVDEQAVGVFFENGALKCRVPDKSLVRLFDLFGRLVFVKGDIDNNVMSFPALIKGAYIIEIVYDGKVLRRKVVI